MNARAQQPHSRAEFRAARGVLLVLRTPAPPVPPAHGQPPAVLANPAEGDEIVLAVWDDGSVTGLHGGRLPMRRRHRRRRCAQHEQHAVCRTEVGAGVDALCPHRPHANPLLEGEGVRAGVDMLPLSFGERAGVRGPRRSLISSAARSTARRISRCVPQRHRLCESASRTWASLGCGSRASSAAVLTIIPFRQ